MNNMKDLFNKSASELKALLLDKQEALRNFRFGLAGSKTRNVKEGKNLRKEIARIHTKLEHMTHIN